MLAAVLIATAISASTEPLLSDSRRHSSDGIQTSNPRLVAVEDELKAVRVEMAAAEAEHQSTSEGAGSMRSELLEALKPAKTQPSRRGKKAGGGRFSFRQPSWDDEWSWNDRPKKVSKGGGKGRGRGGGKGGRKGGGGKGGGKGGNRGGSLPCLPPSVSPTSSNVASDDDDDDDQMALLVGLTVSFGVVTLLVVGMAVVMLRGRAQARRQLKSTAPADVKKPGAPPVSSTEMIDVQKVPPQMQAA